MGNYGWATKDVMPLFHSMECYEEGRRKEVDYGIRGHSGPLHVREVKGCHPLTGAFIESAQSAGYRYNRDYNGAVQEGVGRAQLNQRRGLRFSAADAFLKPVLHRKNLQLVTNACVHKLLLSGRKIGGVRYVSTNGVEDVRADRVILCAGAINTPKILMLSGIGDASALRALGIEVVLDKSAVGRNLIEHPLVRLVYRTRGPTYNLTEGIVQKARFLAKFLFTRQGPLASIVEAQAFLKTSPEAREADIQVHFLPVGLGHSSEHPFILLPYPSLTLLVNINHPASRGQIRLADAGPKSAPLIEPNLLAEERDVESLARGIETIRRIMRSAPIAGMVNEEIMPGEFYREPQSVADYVRNHTELAYHPAGTCRMGIDADAVVAPNLRVKGIANLWAADASVMPDLVSGNINAACMMIGEKLGQQLKGEEEASYQAA
jgi:choline dehydrogenase-like flavoprotein